MEGQALQVVSVDGSSGGYSVDEEALTSALLGAAADRPVVLCSVAGAYRGGKSFLLDYLLRYLRADESARADGTWLGDKDEPLGGFSWRAGSVRDTTGLLLWSQPAVMQLPSGEEVAVLLMDTQGAFDWRSSVRDCSTIFALSALLASVQLYNVSRDVRADELQHLQLFTEYGRMAADGDKAFDKLQLVVRDWGCSYDHPYGADGGAQLLQVRHQEMDGMELQDLWQSLRASFEQVQCFLMPHPGLRALEKNFDGRNADLTSDFKTALLELAPSILSPDNLKPKRVNGELLTGRALYCYFKSYLEIFNSDQMPTPVSILNATVEAGLLAGCEAARAQYRRAMEEQAVSVTRPALRAQHERARDGALRAFSQRRTMAAPALGLARHTQLRQELDEQLVRYETINDAKIMKGIADAETAYKERLRTEVRDLEGLCVHPAELERLHEEAMEAAVTKFNSTRVISEEPDSSDDPDMDILLERIVEIHRSLSEMNEANNKSAVQAATSAYRQRMMALCAPHAPALHARELRKEEEDARSAALLAFHNRRSLNTQPENDHYKQQIFNEIHEQRSEWIKMNERKNKFVVEAALQVYDRLMEKVCNTSLLNPLQTIRIAVSFDEQHSKYQIEALKKFYDLSRTNRRRLYTADDTFLDELNNKLEQRKKIYWEELQKDSVVAGVTGTVTAVAMAVAGIAETRALCTKEAFIFLITAKKLLSLSANILHPLHLHGSLIKPLKALLYRTLRKW